MKQVKLAAAAIALLAAISAWAAPSVHIDSVIQRWPWNNKVDITYTVSEGQDVAAEPAKFYRLVFTATIGDNEYTISGVTNVGASASSGTHTVTWNPPAGLKAKDCTMVAEMFDADAPSGDDYMIVYLEDDNGYKAGTVCYEGLLASQDASNARYNTDDYKTKRLVLRKVPAGGTYYTGVNNSNIATGGSGNNNGRKTWVTDRDYYAGVFMVTQYQYEKIVGTNPSQFKSGTSAPLRPIESVSWTTLRGDASPTNTLVADASGMFFQRLDALTGLDGFDLPTEVMAEIAQRAGGPNDTKYWWGTGSDALEGTNYCVYAISNSNPGAPVAVGSKKPNNWGLYDVSGNLYEWCLDGTSLSDLEDASSPWTAAPVSSSWAAGRRVHGGGCWNTQGSASPNVKYEGFLASWRGSSQSCSISSGDWFKRVGFRVFRIVP